MQRDLLEGPWVTRQVEQRMVGRRAGHRGERQVGSVPFRSYPGPGRVPPHTRRSTRETGFGRPQAEFSGRKCLDCTSHRLSVSFTHDLNTKHFG